MTTIAGEVLEQVNKLLQVVDDHQGRGLTLDEFQRLNELDSSVWGLLGIFRNGKLRYDVRGWGSNTQTGIRINFCEDDNPFYCWIAADTSAANSKWRQRIMSVRAAAQAVVDVQASRLDSQLAKEKTTRTRPLQPKYDELDRLIATGMKEEDAALQIENGNKKKAKSLIRSYYKTHKGNPKRT